MSSSVDSLPNGCTGLERKDRIRHIVVAFERDRAAGRATSEESLVSRYPDLMPELATELGKLRRIAEALDEAAAVKLEQALDRREMASGTDTTGQPAPPSCGQREGCAAPPLLEGSSGEDSRAGAGCIPDRIGRYRVERVLGEGTFGRVFLAWDDDLGREVAVKVPRLHQIADSKDVEAYLTEARVVAGLDHPSIVPVYDVGRTEDGGCFVVSKWIRGSNLASRMLEGRVSQKEAIRTVIAIAEALDYAHGHRLVHRDIKPANILLDEQGLPHVADFGLALKSTAQVPPLTHVGLSGVTERQSQAREPDVHSCRSSRRSFAGTPAYMSPEQARGEAHRVDRRSDVFSLGVVLYEMLTGCKPFQADASEDLLQKILWAEPVPPRQCDASIADECQRICLKAISKRAADRYATAGELAADLSRFLELAGPSPPGQVPFPCQASQEEDSSAAPEGRPERQPLPPVVPKGLRPFDANDSEFFLQLVPGPRDRDGLPESIRRWKVRIEAEDPEEAFSVGVLYGPSGCGKSSLVRAGLLPRLSTRVHALYLETVADDTETQLLLKLARYYPDLPAGEGLAQCLAAVRSGGGPAGHGKLLIVLDQFEQWLQGRGESARRMLVEALRQCDGPRVECLLLVRDDFWLALSRFMMDLEIDLAERRNTAMVDLFDPSHARKVLAKFGRAFGRLPVDLARLSSIQDLFLDRAIEQLTEEDKVVPVRLALFAEMFKSKPWTPATLREVGGAGGIGVTFLEETFSAPTADPRCRAHEQAARAVLEALLPEAGREIKGRVRSYLELLDISGYGKTPKAFKELMGVLDAETRLLTPAEPETARTQETAGARVQRFYQLTHDYLVPALRQWLTRKQKSTRSGRAELCLAERSAMWNARFERRQLPSPKEWLLIRLLARSSSWTPSQRKMMRTAGRHYAFRAALAVLVVLLFFVAGSELMGLAGNLLGRFRARSAAVWMALGHGLDNMVWPLLKESSDPTLRTRLIHGMGLAADAQSLVETIDRHQDISVRRAILLMAGELTSDPETRSFDRTPSQRAVLPPSLVQRLLNLYRDDPDPGVHASAEWALRRYAQGEEVRRVDRQMASAGIRADFGWFVNRQGHTMVVVPGPAWFIMGSPIHVSPDAAEGPQHLRRIRVAFSIASKETTVEQFRTFLADVPSLDRPPGDSVGLLPDAPQTSVTWYEAAAYCNWLSRLEGLPPDQWCYLPNADGRYGSGMTQAPGWFDRRGYRLPTEAEWEYACRAGTTTPRHFGDDASYLPSYGTFDLTGAVRPQAAGRKKPNDFGLFDMLGNAAEWCQDVYCPYSSTGNEPAVRDLDSAAEASRLGDRVVRGGSFRDPAERLRSAARDKRRPDERRDTIGFRVCRGYP